MAAYNGYGYGANNEASAPMLSSVEAGYAGHPGTFHNPQYAQYPVNQPVFVHAPPPPPPPTYITTITQSAPVVMQAPVQQTIVANNQGGNELKVGERFLLIVCAITCPCVYFMVVTDLIASIYSNWVARLFTCRRGSDLRARRLSDSDKRFLLIVSRISFNMAIILFFCFACLLCLNVILQHS